MRRLNWPIWAGAALGAIALFSYPLVFIRWPITRDVPWVNGLLAAAALVLAAAGLRRAWAPARWRWLKASTGVLLAGVTVYACGLFGYGVLIAARHLPASGGAPAIGQRAPDFTLADTSNTQVSLASLLSTP